MSEPLSQKDLEELISLVELAKPPSPMMLFHTVSAWEFMLQYRPEDFAIYNEELFYTGCKVCIIGSKQKEIDKFLCTAKQIISENQKRDYKEVDKE